jgi:hydroxyacylglutathione hydrolase
MDLFNSPVGYYVMNMFAKPPHRKIKPYPHSSGHLALFIIPVLESNYTFLIADRNRKTAIVIDPSQTELVVQTLKKENLKLIAILNTHKHWDHTAGNLPLEAMYPEVVIYGSKLDFEKKTISSSYTKVSKLVEDGDDFEVGGCVFRVIGTPGHTIGSIMYLLDTQESMKRFGTQAKALTPEWDPYAPWLFSGDTLFLAGCGKLFEGDATDLHYSFKKLCKTLDPSTYIFPGHEYTLSNLEFTRVYAEGSFQVEMAFKNAMDCEFSNLPTIPGQWVEELQTNPYLLVLHSGSDAAFWKGLSAKARNTDLWAKLMEQIRTRGIHVSPRETEEIILMAYLREQKNSFKASKSFVI